jgi:hypothetical protein
MTIPQSIRPVLTWFVRLLLVASVFETFFLWAPWLSCKPISEISKEHVPVSGIPPDAECYTIEHGRIYFSTHPTISESPISFALATSALILLIALAVWSFYWGKKT